MILHLAAIIPMVLSIALAVLAYHFNNFELKIIFGMVLGWGLLIHANNVKYLRKRQKSYYR